MVSNNLVGKGVKRQTATSYYATTTNNNKEEEQERPRINKNSITVNTCITHEHDKCTGRYMDTIGLGYEILCQCPCGHRGGKMKDD